MSDHREDDPFHDGDEAEAGRAVHRALVLLGWLPPECDQDVTAAGAELSALGAALPTALADPASAWDRAFREDRPAVRLLHFPVDRGVEEGMARAARRGRKIAPEIEERMRRDREQAERDEDDGRTRDKSR